MDFSFLEHGLRDISVKVGDSIEELYNYVAVR